MNDSFFNLLKKSGSFSEKETLLLRQELQSRVLKREAFLLNKGDVCSSLCFVVSGSFYHYNTDADLNKNIIDLNTTNDWVVNHKSFTTRKPSEYAIQAFEDCSYYELSIDAIYRLIDQSQSFLQM